ncbi:unnamed protein product [Pieris brassicae]|uniref:Uncharacterized protein n=1 Tax=Pieris brassicae TaxID=7116 RepID=A0A9P0TQ05_PIEBR|nr:unnamed protein product [Pieris brassicae]
MTKYSRVIKTILNALLFCLSLRYDPVVTLSQAPGVKTSHSLKPLNSISSRSLHSSPLDSKLHIKSPAHEIAISATSHLVPDGTPYGPHLYRVPTPARNVWKCGNETDEKFIAVKPFSVSCLYI